MVFLISLSVCLSVSSIFFFFPTLARARSHPHPAEQIIVTPRSIVFKTFFAIIRGAPKYIVRQTNLVQNLSCLATMAFVDKSGLLAAPRPEPSKVMIFESDTSKTAPDAEDGKERKVERRGGFSAAALTPFACACQSTTAAARTTRVPTATSAS